MKKVMFSIVALLLAAFGIVQSQTEVPPTPIQSIFDYDTCAPPCWMGLIPGESTAHDVDVMLEQHQVLILPENVTFGISHLSNGEKAIDSDIGKILQALYTFNLGKPYVNTMEATRTSRIEIRGGVVHVILIHSDKRIPLVDGLEALGEPDVVRMMTFRSGTTWMDLIYLKPRLRVGLQQDRDDCTVDSLQDTMIISRMFYLSPSAAAEVGSFAYDIPQTRLLEYLLLEEHDVPLELWRSWLAGDVDMTCEAAWEQLPEPIITPVPEYTPEATIDPR